MITRLLEAWRRILDDRRTLKAHTGSVRDLHRTLKAHGGGRR